MLFSPHSRTVARANKSEQSWKKENFSEPQDFFLSQASLTIFFFTHVSHVLISDESVKTENSFLLECKIWAISGSVNLKKKKQKSAAPLKVFGYWNLKLQIGGSTKGQLACKDEKKIFLTLAKHFNLRMKCIRFLSKHEGGGKVRIMQI